MIELITAAAVWCANVGQERIKEFDSTLSSKCQQEIIKCVDKVESMACNQKTGQCTVYAGGNYKKRECFMRHK